jgi:hypothetical protein
MECRGNRAVLPFFAPPTASTTIVDPDPGAGSSSRQLRVSVHDDAESLPSRVNDYVVEQSTGVAGIVLSGPLAVGDADRRSALQAAGARLGVDLTAGHSFMLVRLVRDAGKAVHSWTEGEGVPADYLSPPGPAGRLQASLRIRHQPGHAHRGGSTQVLEFFAEYGTHFVSQIRYGEVITQVFTYKHDRFEDVRAGFDRMTNGQPELIGENAHAFRYYTSPATADGKGGFVSEHGRIISATQDTALTETLSKNRWKDAEYGVDHSIFGAFAPANKGLLFKLVKVTAQRSAGLPSPAVIKEHQVSDNVLPMNIRVC